MTSEDDERCWQELIKDVRRLPHDKPPLSGRKTELRVVPKISPDRVYRGAALADIVIGGTDNIDANTARRFKRGEFKTEAELDLHGYTENKAFDAVVSFVKRSYLKGRRCIAIITGKGLHQHDEDGTFAGRGVLKERVPQWLNQPDIRPLILAVHHPEHRQGGSGVIRILLRRQRERRTLFRPEDAAGRQRTGNRAKLFRQSAPTALDRRSSTV